MNKNLKKTLIFMTIAILSGTASHYFINFFKKTKEEDISEKLKNPEINSHENKIEKRIKQEPINNSKKSEELPQYISWYNIVLLVFITFATFGIGLFFFIILPLIFAIFIKNDKGYFSRFQIAFLNNLKIIPVVIAFYLLLCLVFFIYKQISKRSDGI